MKHVKCCFGVRVCVFRSSASGCEGLIIAREYWYYSIIALWLRTLCSNIQYMLVHTDNESTMLYAMQSVTHTDT